MSALLSPLNLQAKVIQFLALHPKLNMYSYHFLCLSAGPHLHKIHVPTTKENNGRRKGACTYAHKMALLPKAYPICLNSTHKCHYGYFPLLLTAGLTALIDVD